MVSWVFWGGWGKGKEGGGKDEMKGFEEWRLIRWVDWVVGAEIPCAEDAADGDGAEGSCAG